MSKTLQMGSQGSDVEAWQKVLGLPVQDGIFGEVTHAATLDWQTAHGLDADGIVGPKTWASAHIEIGAEAESPATKTDKWAWQVAQRANEMLKKNNAGIRPYTERELQYGVSVARGEGYYGKGWGSIAKDAPRFGLVGNEGLGSNNWGAHQGTGSAGSFPHVDYHADGSAYVGTYKRYLTPEEGFLDMMHTIFYPNPKRKKVDVATAIKNGSLRKAVFGQHANGYFELAPEKYLKSVMSNYQKISQSTGWPKLLSENGSSAIWGVLGGVLAYVGLRKAYGYYKGRKEKKDA